MESLWIKTEVKAAGAAEGEHGSKELISVRGNQSFL
jgi:hypothetical protein